MSADVHPYTDVLLPIAREDDDGVRAEEMLAYMLMFVVGLIPVTITVYGGRVFDGEATIGVMLAGAGLVGFIARLFGRR